MAYKSADKKKKHLSTFRQAEVHSSRKNSINTDLCWVFSVGLVVPVG